MSSSFHPAWLGWIVSVPEGAVGGVVEDAPDAGHAHPYTPGRQTFAAAVEVHVLPLWVTFAPSG